MRQNTDPKNDRKLDGNSDLDKDLGQLSNSEDILYNSECSRAVNDSRLKLYSKSEAAKLLGIRKSILLTWIENGELGSLQVGKRIKISHLELEKFLKNKTTRNIPIIKPDFNNNNGSTNLDNEINSIIQGEY